MFWKFPIYELEQDEKVVDESKKYNSVSAAEEPTRLSEYVAQETNSTKEQCCLILGCRYELDRTYFPLYHSFVFGLTHNLGPILRLNCLF